jgi:hypothetical protein
MARPPIAEARLSVDGDGLVVYELKHAFSDGTTHVLFEPQDFIARLAALDCRAGIVPDNPLHSRHCTWMCESGHPWRSDAGDRATQEQLPRCLDRAPISSDITACSRPLHMEVPVPRSTWMCESG